MRPLISATCLALALTATACSTDEQPAKVKERAADVQTEAADETSEPAEPTAPEEAVDETTSEAVEPAAPSVGDLLEVGDWDVRVTKVNRDAGEAIKKANQFNSKAKGVFVLVTYKATYNGDERTADAEFDLTWSFTTSDQQVNDQAYEVTPMDEAPSEARNGGTITNDVVFDLPAKLISGGTLTVETIDEDFETVFGDIAID